jgi:anionic cell wall polymer biosynthesis LytR-Cps2A-Psr (LCP) family protein
VRSRTPFSDGDVDRAQRQQNVLRALVSRVAEPGTLTSPAGTYELLDAASRSVSVDDTLENGGLRTLASDLNGLESDDIVFVRAPVAAPGWEGGRPVVHLDPARSIELWSAMRADLVATYAASHPTDTVGPVTR